MLSAHGQLASWPAVCSSLLCAVDIEPRFNPTICCDFGLLCPHQLKKIYGRVDFVWFSPPCNTFSGANRISPEQRDWDGAMRLVRRAYWFVQVLHPARGFVIENPRTGALGATCHFMATCKMNKHRGMFLLYKSLSSSLSDAHNVPPVGR